ncbi:DUF2956 domain-containing protein [Methylocaldum sp. RMAD-M]|uniref:DUF2956 domain-containing protein n=1 Tax=Methylocaldum sp. RMAD-M TaxID=2806557 RepID=UPI001AE85092|nr:DUF2956 domain-containing protein [Methylocaldum sp. RMAD-M]MBP1151130.1 hypothetical protein [Methylocaldum sp. RMAD-M]
MSKTDSRPSIQTQVNENIQEEALKVAKSIQKPGQTKEQTKLIAQGIAKGIELYKKQQSAKARERDKVRKKALKLKQVESTGQQREEDEADFTLDLAESGISGMLLLGGGVFAVMAGILAVSLVAGWPASLGPFTLPVWASLAAVIAFAGFSGWFFYKAIRLNHGQ